MSYSIDDNDHWNRPHRNFMAEYQMEKARELDDDRKDIEAANKNSGKNINIMNRSSGGGAMSNVQYNNINIHIHIEGDSDKLNDKKIKKLVDALTDNLGGNGSVDPKKSNILNFFKERY